MMRVVCRSRDILPVETNFFLTRVVSSDPYADTFIMLYIVPILRHQTRFTRFLTRTWVVGSVMTFLWLWAVQWSEERDFVRHGVLATLVLDPPAIKSESTGRTIVLVAPGPAAPEQIHASFVEADGRASQAPSRLLGERTINELRAGHPVLVQFLRQDPWGTVRLLGERGHAGILLLVATLLAILGARYWKRI